MRTTMIITAGVLTALVVSSTTPGAATVRAAAPPAPGTTLVSETFTGADADPRFHGSGPACLTGAATAASTPAGGPLGGCGPDPVGPVPPSDGAPHGYLRLTDTAHDQSAAVLFDQPLPATEGATVSFDQWQYGGTPNTPTSRPADGISFFLVDGAAQLTAPGAFGGSLGYAQKLPDNTAANPFLPGVDHGYLGVGMDVLGNYFGDWEHRGFGCPPGRQSPSGTGFFIPAPGENMVTVRGPGQGTEGYCFLTATSDHLTTTGPWHSTLPGQLHGPTTAADLPPGTTPAAAETVLTRSQRTITVEVTPTPDPQVNVWVDFHDGAGPRQVLSAPAPQPIPPTYKFGFASSTGLFTDVHLIRTVTVSTLRPLPKLDLVKQVDEARALPAVLTAGFKIPYQFVVTNSGGSPITDLAVTDPIIGHITCPTTVLAAGATVTCTGRYTITASDVKRGYVTNTAVAAGTSSTGPTTSPPSSVSLPLGGKDAIELDKQVDTSKTYNPGDKVHYDYVVTNVGDEPLDRLRVGDDRIGQVTCPVTKLAARGLPGSSTVCTARYRVTGDDAEHGHVTNTAVAVANGGATTSPPAQARITVRRVLPVTGAATSYEAATAGLLLGMGSILMAVGRSRRRGRTRT